MTPESGTGACGLAAVERILLRLKAIEDQAAVGGSGLNDRLCIRDGYRLIAWPIFN
jgi:hypothetical protein